jgi:uncharacterized protein (TIGR01777 family)
MHIVIAGGTGFLGRPLIDAFVAEGHDVTVLTRQSSLRPAAPRQRAVYWTPDGTTGPWAGEIVGANAIVNLAGESIAAGRWTTAQKQRVLESRVQATRSLTAAIAAAATPPAVLISGSAVGYYGPLGEEVVTEGHAAGADFLATVCLRWEQEAMRAQTPHTRVACLRTGLVLERDGGAFPRILLPFRLGAGGPLGSGRQYWPWIHRSDWIEAVRFVLHTAAASGALNVTAPHPVTNAQFAKAIGRAMHRPAFVPTPAFALRLALGEMADGLLLSGQRAVPARLQQLGFAFAHRDLDSALRAILQQ